MTHTSKLLIDEIYIWSNQHSLFGKRPKIAIISAHGSETMINGNFPKPKQPYKLSYLCQHGHILASPGVSAWNMGDPVVVEERTSADPGQDYLLTKFQNRHSDFAETYTKGYFNNTFDKIGDDFDKDIITIKNKTQKEVGKNKILLSQVIEILISCGYNYENFYCAFCRGREPAQNLKMQFGDIILTCI